MNLAHRLSILVLAAWSLVASCLTGFAQNTPGASATFLVQDGAFPWHDRVNTWALSDVPPSLTGTTPLPQQSCSSRALEITGSPSAILFGVADADLQRFKAAFPAASETGEKLGVKNSAGAVLGYRVFKLANPPQRIQAEPPFGAGLILLKVEGGSGPAASAPALPAATPAVAKPEPLQAFELPMREKLDTPGASATFLVQDGAFPWHDRVNTWALSDVPPSLTGTTPLPQQSCSSRALEITGSPSAILFGVADADLQRFKAAFPAASETGEKLGVKNSAGAVLGYRVFKLANPPQRIQAEPPFGAGLILLKVEGGSAPAASAPALPAATPAVAKPEPLQAFELPMREKLDLYLLMGQSNMVGRDTTGLDAQKKDPRIGFCDGKGQWWIAREPMHAGGSGIGPGIPFAAEMLKAVDAQTKIGLIPCAIGGTPLSRWVKGGDLYQKALGFAQKAAAVGQLKGILWHQGESDSRKAEDAESYETRLSQMLQDIRADLGMPEIPIVVGQLGEFVGGSCVATVRTAITHIPASVPHVGFADSKGLGHKGDSLHFSADAEREMGRRFAAAMQELKKKPAGQ